jgi:catechol 2,3-dioxygenase-like lactoylglutathione lyase family enzyme
VTAILRALHPVLFSSDIARSIGFYRALGFALGFVDDPEDTRYAGLVRDAVELHLQWGHAQDFAGTGDRPVYRLLVSDADALFDDYVAAGVIDRARPGPSPWAMPGDTPWGTREFHLRDPDGNGLQFYARRA